MLVNFYYIFSVTDFFFDMNKLIHFLLSVMYPLNLF